MYVPYQRILHHFVLQKNQNVPIVTLVQNALYLGQRILHQCNNWYILIFVVT